MNSIKLIMALAFVCVSCFGGNKISDDQNKIVYAELVFINGKPSVNSIKVVDGFLKKQKKNTLNDKPIFFEVLNTNNEILDEGYIEDPSNKFYEYTDEDGNYKTTNVKKDTAFTFVRFRFDEAQKKMNLYKIPSELNLQKGKEGYLLIGSFNINNK